MTLTVPVWHGPALDAAIERARDPLGLEREVCATALSERVSSLIDSQLDELVEGSKVEAEVRELMREALGREPTKDEVYLLNLRGIIGGMFTLGLQAGIELRQESKSVTA